MNLSCSSFQHDHQDPCELVTPKAANYQDHPVPTRGDHMLDFSKVTFKREPSSKENIQVEISEKVRTERERAQFQPWELFGQDYGSRV